jgi:hypothetical protein
MMDKDEAVLALPSAGDAGKYGMQAEIDRLHGIAALARQVREAQKKYFKTRDRNDLIASKQLERRLDDALANG